MEPLEFCRQMMSEYEEQWTEARGHQERHPLRAKMAQLETLMDRLRRGEQLESLLQAGTSGDDPMLFLLCEDLRQKWEREKEKEKR